MSSVNVRNFVYLSNLIRSPRKYVRQPRRLSDGPAGDTSGGGASNSADGTKKSSSARFTSECSVTTPSDQM